MTIHERIKSRRKECQMSVEDVANELGVSRSTIYRYESSEISNIGIDKIEPLARVLHTTPEYLMGWTEDPIDYSDGDLIAEIPGCYVEACEGDIKHAYAMMQAVDKDNRGTHVKESCANRIRAGLSMRGMTQSDLCRITGIPKSAPQFWSAARSSKKDLHSRRRMSSLLRVNTRRLLTVRRGQRPRS